MQHIQLPNQSRDPITVYLDGEIRSMVYRILLRLAFYNIHQLELAYLVFSLHNLELHVCIYIIDNVIRYYHHYSIVSPQEGQLSMSRATYGISPIILSQNI